MKLHHIGFATGDLEGAIKYYTRLFGYRLVQRRHFEGTPLAFLRRDSEEVLLELFQSAEPEEAHAAYQTDDLRQEVARLQKAGFTVQRGPVPIWDGGETAFCRAPGGELVELICDRSS